jgi:hypothetical protein
MVAYFKRFGAVNLEHLQHAMADIYLGYAACGDTTIY